MLKYKPCSLLNETKLGEFKETPRIIARCFFVHNYRGGSAALLGLYDGLDLLDSFKVNISHHLSTNNGNKKKPV